MQYKISFFLSLALIILTFSFLKYQYFDKQILTQDYTFFIPTDTNFDELNNHLHQIAYPLHPISKLFLDSFVSKKRLEYWFRPGRYLLSKSFSLNDIINKLRSRSQDPVDISFNSMDNVDSFFGIISQKLELDSITLKNYIDSINFVPDSFYFILIPNTYEFFWNISAKDLIERMHSEYDKFWTNDRLRLLETIHLSKNDVFILASIVDKEASHFDEMPRISGLYLNRLREGWPLASDPTILYILRQKSSQIIRRVRNKHIDNTKDSRFNTYYHKGLPPKPICIPSFQALEAVLSPEKHDYMYMCARPDRSEYHNFSKTYIEHKNNASQFHRWLDKRKIY